MRLQPFLCYVFWSESQANTRLETDPPPISGVDGARGATAAGLEREKPSPSVSGRAIAFPINRAGPYSCWTCSTLSIGWPI